MSYLETIFIEHIDKEHIKVIFEIGSRDLLDGFNLQKYYNAKVYSFECNPDCLMECEKNLASVDPAVKDNIVLVKQAVSIEDGDISFYPFDLTKYDNMGASSLLKIDFSNRNPQDPDYNLANPQNEITVSGTRLDTFMKKHNITNVDMICMDLQGYELNALKSLGDHLHNVKYIITECSIKNTYINGVDFKDLAEYLLKYKFLYVSSNSFNHKYPDLDDKGAWFDAIFINTSYT